jgi:predicted RNA-binding Zn ribbon-like protein
MNPHGSYARHPPKLIAGARGLDFVNTVEWRADPETRRERLVDYAELTIWCAKAGLIGAAEAKRLVMAARRKRREARAVLRRAIALREASVAVLRQPSARHAAALDRALQAAHCRPTLSIADGLRFAPLAAGLDRPFVLVALEVAALFATQPLDRVHSCANPRCGWMFVDTSRNRARRWCEMAGCGNRAKAHAHYARVRRA